MGQNRNEFSAKAAATTGGVAGGFFVLATETHRNVDQVINNTGAIQEVPVAVKNMFLNIMSTVTFEKIITGCVIGATFALFAYGVGGGKEEDAEPAKPLTSSIFSNTPN